MISDDLPKVAGLLDQRNAIDGEIAAIIQRPMTSGHLGEWIASRVFDIQLESSAAARGIDGRFRNGPLRGKAVNVKWYLKREGILDVADSDELDFYLVLAGPTSPAVTSRGSTRPGRSTPSTCSMLVNLEPNSWPSASGSALRRACARRVGKRPRSIPEATAPSSPSQKSSGPGYRTSFPNRPEPSDPDVA